MNTRQIYTSEHTSISYSRFTLIKSAFSVSSWLFAQGLRNTVHGHWEFRFSHCAVSCSSHRTTSTTELLTVTYRNIFVCRTPYGYLSEYLRMPNSLRLLICSYASRYFGSQSRDARYLQQWIRHASANQNLLFPRSLRISPRAHVPFHDNSLFSWQHI